MLLGLFFVTTGASMDVSLLLHEWNIVLSLLVGLIAVKIGIIGSVAPFFGLNRHGLLLCLKKTSTSSLRLIFRAI